MTPDRGDLEELLSAAFGVRVVLGGLERLAPWSVMRATPVAREGVPDSVIIKWFRDPRWARTEHRALRFLADDLGVRLAPRALAADPVAGVLVLEDLAPREPLDHLLRRDGAHTGRAGLVAFARTLGELGAVTAGRDALYHAPRGDSAPPGAAPHWVDEARADREMLFGRVWRETVRCAAELGAGMAGPAEKELAEVLTEMAEPGPFLTLTNGDSNANNFLADGGGDTADGRLIDFEFAAYRHVLTGAACLYVPGPGWITVLDPVASGLEAVYRGALERGVEQAGDDRRFGRGIATACLAVAIERLHRLPRLDRRPPGDDSRVQMVATLESAAGAADAHRALPHLAGWARRAAAVLRRRWRDADIDLTAYPPYAPRRR